MNWQGVEKSIQPEKKNTYKEPVSGKSKGDLNKTNKAHVAEAQGVRGWFMRREVSVTHMEAFLFCIIIFYFAYINLIYS